MTTASTGAPVSQPHAIVIGGSMAGLLAARALSDHYARVTLVERDVLPVDASQRRGVPQGHHTHGLLAGGREALDRLFPGLSLELVGSGAIAGDLVGNTRWFFEGAPLARVVSGLDGVMASRPALEAAVRRRVRALRNVTVRDGDHVVGLVTDEDRTTVTGVTLLNGNGLAADLVVDATGRGSRAVQWLRSLGYAAPVEERVEVGLSYTTRLFQRDKRHLDGDLGIVVPPTPAGKRGGVLIAQEGDRWTVTLIAHFVPAAGEDIDAFRSFAALLPSGDIYDVLRTAEPIGEAMSARFPASIRRRFERLRRFPEGFVVMGDAICSFNPIYGQGMSVAAQEAEALGAVVANGRPRIGHRFFRAASRIVDTPWTTAVGNDLRMPEAVGTRSLVGTAINAYVAKLQRAAHTDAVLAVRFMRITNLLAHPLSMFTPAMMWRVLKGTVARYFSELSGSQVASEAPARVTGLR